MSVDDHTPVTVRRPPPEWVTAHLRLRPCASGDRAALHALWCDAAVRKYLFDDREIAGTEAATLVATSDTTFALHGYGIWLVAVEAEPGCAGFVGLMHQPTGAPNLLYGLRPSWWGRGYTTEAATAVLRYAFLDLGLERVTADVDEPNVASVHVLEKLGMLRTRRAVVAGRPLLYYEIQATDAAAILGERAAR